MNDTRWNMNPNKAKAIMLARRQLAEFVYDAVNLEGISFTLPEIQTLLDGITVGGHRVTDQRIALNQADTWRVLFDLVESNQFDITAKSICALHLIAAKDEAMEWGKFRSGGVTISGTDSMPPPAKRQLEFNQLMLSFYETGDQAQMNAFLCSCLDEKVISIMKEDSI